MAQTLDQFAAQMKTQMAKFEAAYQKASAENPLHYPLSLPDDNEGLWLEMFLTFLESGKV